MVFKRKKIQSAHDKSINRAVGQLKRIGATGIRASHVEGMKDPTPKNGRKADLEYTFRDKRIIKEFETPSSMKTDKEQRADLKKYARGRKNTFFRTKVVK